MKEIRAVYWSDDRLHLIDQTLLPAECRVLEIERWEDVVTAIKEMRVRGAPALGVTAAYALSMAARDIRASGREEFMSLLRSASETIVAARPTAVNIAWAVDRLMAVVKASEDMRGVPSRLLQEAHRLQRDDEAANRALGAHGAALMPSEGGVLTHCNTGALATAGYGTALGVIRAAWEQGKRFHVYNTETRPWLQGARLTSWELGQLGIPGTLMVDSAAGLLMRQGKVSCVVLGADRIAANGDTANKIGTYMLAVLAHENGIPFYVAAPVNTVDLSTSSGDDIVIEDRPPQEVTGFGGVRTAPDGVQAVNPAFDVTPHRYITAIITDRGVVRPPYVTTLRRALNTDV